MAPQDSFGRVNAASTAAPPVNNVLRAGDDDEGEADGTPGLPDVLATGKILQHDCDRAPTDVLERNCPIGDKQSCRAELLGRMFGMPTNADILKTVYAH